MARKTLRLSGLLRGSRDQRSYVFRATVSDPLPVGNRFGHKLLASFVRIAGSSAEPDYLFEECIFDIRIRANLAPFPTGWKLETCENENLYFLPRDFSEEPLFRFYFIREYFLDSVRTLLASFYFF